MNSKTTPTDLQILARRKAVRKALGAYADAVEDVTAIYRHFQEEAIEDKHAALLTLAVILAIPEEESW